MERGSLVIHDHIIQYTIVAYNNPLVRPQFCRTGTWAGLCWVILLFHMAWTKILDSSQSGWVGIQAKEDFIPMSDNLK